MVGRAGWLAAEVVRPGVLRSGGFLAASTDGLWRRRGRPANLHARPVPPILPVQRRELVVVTGRALVDQDVRQGRSISLFRGVHVDSRMRDDFLTRCRAALLTQGPDAVLSHRTAAVVLGLRWLPARWATSELSIDVAVPPAPTTTRRRPGLCLWERLIAPDERVDVDGLACTSPTRTLVELARETKLPALLVVQLMDGAIRDERTSVEALYDCTLRLRGHANIRRARELALRARPGVDSPMETRLRLTLEDGGVTGLVTDVRIEEDGRLLARSELADPRLLLWGEYDGYDVHTQQGVFDADRPRHRWVEGRGWKVMRFSNGDFATGAICRDWLYEAALAPARIAAMSPSRSPEVAEAWRLLGLR